MLQLQSAGFGAESGKGSKPETVVRWHFAGTKQLATVKELKTLREILALPESDPFRDAAVATLANKAGLHFAQAGSTNANPAVVNLLKPLLTDLIQNESRLELSAREGKDASWVCAVRLEPGRADGWSKSLVDLARSAQMSVSDSSGEKSWTAAKDDYHFSFSHSKDWIVLEGGFSKNPVDSKTFKEFRSGLGKKSGKSVLDAEINFPLLGKIWNGAQFAHFPKIDWHVLPHKDGLRSEGLIDYPQALNISPEKWNVPTDLIRDPLIGFTALQGVGGKLGELEGFKRLGAQKAPNQIFLWSQENGPFAVFAAADVGNPADVVKTIGTKVLPSMKTSAGGTIEVSTNRPLIQWRGLPIVIPFAEQAPAPNASFIETGLFPLASTNLPPRELFEQLNQKNLIFYDWEITQARLQQWWPIWQLEHMIQDKILPGGTSLAWLTAIGPKLGNTVTEARIEGPSRLKFIRQSQSGLAALELVLLADWLAPAAAPAPGRARPASAPRTNRPTPAPAARPVSGAPTP